MREIMREYAGAVLSVMGGTLLLALAEKILLAEKGLLVQFVEYYG